MVFPGCSACNAVLLLGLQVAKLGLVLLDDLVEVLGFGLHLDDALIWMLRLLMSALGFE